MMNCLEWLPIYFGILKTGALAVPLNFRYTADEIKYCLDLAEVDILVFGPEFIGRIEDIAAKIKKDPTKSLVYDQRDLVAKKFSAIDLENIPEFTTRRKLALLAFVLTFAIMILGIMKLGWWFADLVGVALILGVARAVTILLDNGNISGTILEGLSSAVSGMPPAVFLVLLMLVYVILGFFINSSSGLAVLSIPIMAPLADIVGIPRELIVSAYVYGLGIITFITPTGIVMPSLEVVETTYDRWLKLSIPLVLILTVWGAIMLIVQLMFT